MRLLTITILLFISISVNASDCLDGSASQEIKFKACLKLAKKGDASSQFHLGVMYLYGEGVTQDYTEAVKWHKKAARQHHARSQNNLGSMYYEGKGVTKNYKEAIKWYKKAANQGDADSQHDLAEMYYYGKGVIQDYVSAYKWFELAAVDDGETGEQAKINRTMTSRKMTEKQIVKAQELARNFKANVSNR